MALHRYSFWVCIAFLGGIALHSIWPETSVSAFVWSATLSTMALVVVVLRRVHVCLLLCVLVSGIWLFDRTIPRPSEGLLSFIGQEVSVEGRVLETGRSPQSPDFVRVHSVNDARVHGVASVMAVRLPAEAKAATNVSFSCGLKVLSSNVFGRGSYLRRDAWTSCTGVESFHVRPTSSFDVLSFLTRSRERLTERIHARYASDDAGLLAGMLYGDEELSKDRRDAYREAGLIHLIAVSGANVTLVVSILMPIAFLFSVTRRTAFLCATIGLCAFLGFVGPSAAVVRAGIMGWLVLLAWEFGRLPRAEHLLICAATAICFVNPRALAFDVGFHLSMLATWGLLAWAGPLEKRLPWIPSTMGLRSALATSLAVTGALTPYALWMFGTYSIAGVFTNIVALPLVPWIMLFGALSVVVPDALVGIATVPVTGFLHMLHALADLGSRFPALETSEHPVLILIATYLGIFCVDRWKRYPHSRFSRGVLMRCVGILRQRIHHESPDAIGTPERATEKCRALPTKIVDPPSGSS